jgi:hypothetical protein
MPIGRTQANIPMASVHFRDRVRCISPRYALFSRFSILAAFLAPLIFPLAGQAYEPPVVPAPRPFAYPDDTFAFKNETTWNYVNGSPQPETRARSQREYTGRCMVLARASVQFWKFARFNPDEAPLPPDQLVSRIREVCARSVWLPALAPRDRIVIPGYHNLREASAKMGNVFQANIGLGWPFYFRAGNIVIAAWVTRSIEDRLNGEIYRDLQMNTPTIIWVYRFPSLKMNHVVVVYTGRRDARGYHYLVYDTNYRDASKHLDYDPQTRTFSFEPVYYFKGGAVTVRSIYRGLLQ